MNKERLSAFTDGVVAVIITIMVLELKPPHGVDLAALRGLIPTFLAYVLSFVYVAIYWNNHHHFFNLVRQVDGAVLWANIQLLFWISLVPFTTAWMGENPTAPIPVAVYGVSVLMPALGWMVMQAAIIHRQGPSSPLKAALGADLKGRLSPILCGLGICAAFFNPWVADALYASVSLMWLIPDRRIERLVVKD
jgi:TMEM175 potassium channel family protein